MHEKRTRSEDGMILFTAMIIVMLVTGLIVSYLMVSTSNLGLTAANQEATECLYVAETGLARAVHQLNIFDMSTFKDSGGAAMPNVGPYPTGSTYKMTGNYVDVNDPAHDVGRFTVEIEVLALDIAHGNRPLRARLTSTGEFREMTRAVEVCVAYQTTADLNHAVLVERDLDITGSMAVWGDVHTNGDGIVRGSANINPAEPALSDLSDPPTDIAFGGNVTAVGALQTVGNAFSITGFYGGSQDRVPIPQIDPEAILARAEAMGIPVHTYDGSQTFSSGTRANDGTWSGPDISLDGIVYVNGDVTISGRLVGDAVIIASGNIHVTGNVELAPQGATVPSTLLLLAQNNIDLTGNPVVEGILYATNGFQGRGNVTVYGVVIAAYVGAEDLVIEETNGKKTTKKTLTGSIEVHFVRPGADQEDLFKKWTLVSWRQVAPKQ